MVNSCQNCQKLLRLLKIVKIIRNYQDCWKWSKLLKIIKIVKNCQNSQKLSKLSKIIKTIKNPSIPFIVYKYNDTTDNGQMWGEYTPYYDLMSNQLVHKIQNWYIRYKGHGALVLIPQIGTRKVGKSCNMLNNLTEWKLCQLYLNPLPATPDQTLAGPGVAGKQ